MSVAFRFAARSNIGLGRYKNNQDSGFAGPHILAVCDGMGGHAGGDVASSIAVGQLASLDSDSLGSDAPQELVKTIRAAHAEMLERASTDMAVAGLATTVTALMKFGGKLALAHIGDSRAYLLSDDTFVQVTKDHTFVQWLVDQGTITEEDAAVHPQRSVIIRVLGDVDAPDEIDTSVREATIGDRWLLCTDGVSSYVSDSTIEATLRNVTDPDQCAEQLIELALKGGGQDNITCVVADIVDAVDDDQSLSPQAVGAASVLSSNPVQGVKTAAEKAAELTAPPETIVPENVATKKWWQRATFKASTIGILITLILATIGVGLYAGYRWSQSQYYVAAHDGNVAIFRGISEKVGPFELSTLHDKRDFPVDSLPEAPRTRVEDEIVTDDLPHAERVVISLIQQSKLCIAVNKAKPMVNTTPLQTPEPTPTDGETTPAPPPAGTPEPPIPSPIAPNATSTPDPATEPENTTEPTPEPTETVTANPTTGGEVNYLGKPLPQECDS